MKAKVFVSCGQTKDSSEEDIVRQIFDLLAKSGFEPYVAIFDRSLIGFKENIFHHLETSDYYLFIDFQRELLGGTTEHRGSLFTHQELAVASYIGLPVLAFQQEGVRTTDGMLAVLQVNPIRFRRHTELIPLIEANLEAWSPYHKNLIHLQLANNTGTIWYINRDSNLPMRIFHLNVQNLSHLKTALQCTAYLSLCINEETKQPLLYRQAELKWSGITFPSVNLFPGSNRDLDGVWVDVTNPSSAFVFALTDSDGYFPRLEKSGTYLLKFTILSTNFTPSHGYFRLTLGNSIDDARLESAKIESDD